MTNAETTFLPLLYITHNYGEIVMRDVTVTGNIRSPQEVTGVPIRGGWTSWFLGSKSFRPADTTQPMTYPLYGRSIYPGYSEGQFVVDVCFCG
jgi:hypothetical protein